MASYAEINVGPKFGPTFGGENSRVGYAVGTTIDYELNSNWSVGLEALYMDEQNASDTTTGDVYVIPRGLLTANVRYDIPLPKGYEEINPYGSIGLGVQPTDFQRTEWSYTTTDDNDNVVNLVVEEETDSAILGVFTATLGVNIRLDDISEGKNLGVGVTFMQTTSYNFLDESQNIVDKLPMLGNDDYTASTVMLFLATEF
jgi:opacity protein-like surface antigen